jgi:glycosyltransferase involved in cell wall biosynthesis
MFSYTPGDTAVRAANGSGRPCGLAAKDIAWDHVIERLSWHEDRLLLPLPPKRTGVASYSRHFVPALAEQSELHLFDNGPVQPPAQCPLVDYISDPQSLLSLDSYDASVYHIGNNPWDHSYIYDVFLHHPGVVVLHDAVLYFLMAGRGPGALLKELYMENGNAGLLDWSHIAAVSPGADPLQYPFPERFPLVTRVLRNAQAIIVHSNTTKRRLLEYHCEPPIYVINMIASSSTDDRSGPELRKELGLPAETLLIGTFGFIGPTKRRSTIFRALSSLGPDFPGKLLVVGQGQDVGSMIRSFGLQDRVICPGFLPDADLEKYLKAVDIVINLRYPSMGETSLTLIQAMYHARPCIVTNDAWFSELPDSCLWKISMGETELEELRQAIASLADDPDRRRALGDAAHDYVTSHCMPDQVAVQYKEVLGQVSSSGKTTPRARRGTQPIMSSAVAPADQADTSSWLPLYFTRRMARALPAAISERDRPGFS